MKRTTTALVLVFVVCGLIGWGLAQATKSDRQLLTEAIALLDQVRDTSSEWTSSQRTAYRNGETRIRTARDQRPSDTPPPPPPPPPPPSPPVPPTGNLIFTSSWEMGPLGCGDQLLDGAWSEYGGSGACSGPVHDADIVNDVAKFGTRSLRITQKPGGINGTDFRALRRFGFQSELTLIGWVRYASNYHWASADHKIFIFTDANGNAQHVYINFRGGSDGQHARLCAAAIPSGDAVFCAATPQVTLDTWYRIRVHLVSGTHGKMELWLQQDGQAEVKLNLIHDAGPTANVNDLNTGLIGGVKIDTTYNAGTSITSNMYHYYDAVSVYSGLAQ